MLNKKSTNILTNILSDTVGKIDSSFLQGLATGGVVGLGSLGLSSGLHTLMKSIFQTPKVPTEIVIDVNAGEKRRKESQTKSGQEKSAVWDWAVDPFVRGVGLSTGILGSIGLVDYLDRASHQGDVAAKIKELSNLYEDRLDEEDKDKEAVAAKKASYCDNYTQKEKIDILECYDYGYKESLAAVAPMLETSDREFIVKKALDPTGLPGLYLTMLGATLPIGGLAGYYLGKQIFPAMTVDEEYSNPNLRFVHGDMNDKKKKEREKSSAVEKDAFVTVPTLIWTALAAAGLTGGYAAYHADPLGDSEDTGNILTDVITPGLIGGALGYGAKSLYDYANTEAPYGYEAHNLIDKSDKKKKKNGI